MKTVHYLEKAGSQLLEAIERPYRRPIDLTLEEKETEARLNGCALMNQGGNLFVLCVDAFGIGQPNGNKWRLIHRANSFNSLKS